MKVKDITNCLEDWAPLSLQEAWDNSGLITGNPETEVSGVMVCLDLNPEVVTEAMKKRCNLIISHHPLVFHPIKSITGKNSVEETLILLIKNNMAAYAMHTNLDNVQGGINTTLGEKLGLVNARFLRSTNMGLVKLVTFTPLSAAQDVREALFCAGAGHIGNYDSCSFNTDGEGTFRAGLGTKPFVGKQHELHLEKETRIEVVLPSTIQQDVISALLASHPYEEVAYDLYPMLNSNPSTGSGLLGVLEKECVPDEFINTIKTKLNVSQIKYTHGRSKKIRVVALCGGAGSFLIPDAIKAGADAFITADLKYHDFQMFEKRILLIDAGHYESEILAKDIIKMRLCEKFPNFAVLISKADKNPVKYA